MSICGDILWRPEFPIVGDPDVPCCWGTIDDRRDCSCWVPLYDVVQAPPNPGLEPRPLPAMCAGCAFRPGTEADEWRKLTGDPERPTEFYCHEQTRRCVGWLHPATGVVVSREGQLDPDPGGAEHDPPLIAGRPHDADGAPSPLCAGWVARYR